MGSWGGCEINLGQVAYQDFDFDIISHNNEKIEPDSETFGFRYFDFDYLAKHFILQLRTFPPCSGLTNISLQF